VTFTGVFFSEETPDHTIVCILYSNCCQGERTEILQRSHLLFIPVAAAMQQPHVQFMFCATVLHLEANRKNRALLLMLCLIGSCECLGFVCFTEGGRSIPHVCIDWPDELALYYSRHLFAPLCCATLIKLLI